nr:MAG: hypothetical protein 1 [Leviviridae sp.]
MASRYRTRVTPHTRGTVTYSDGSVYIDAHNNDQVEDCTDVTGAGDCWEFTLNRTSWAGGDLNTYFPSSKTFSNFRVDGVTGQFTPNTSFPGQKPSGTYATEAAARTNPSRPYVDIPVSLFELGDAAQLIQKAGRSLIREYAGRHLETQFFWKPLISDLYKMVSFHEQVARRTQEFNRLKGAKGFRKTVLLDTLSASKQILWDPQSAHLNLPSRYEQVISSRVIKGHCRWLATADLSKMPSREAVDKIRRSLLGITIDASTVWELIPFSWLIDWGFNIGAYLKANRNIIPARLDYVTIIEHSVHRAEFGPMTSGAHTMSAGYWKKEVKRRYRQTVFPTAHFPFLSESQVGIVAALAILNKSK